MMRFLFDVGITAVGDKIYVCDKTTIIFYSYCWCTIPISFAPFQAPQVKPTPYQSHKLRLDESVELFYKTHVVSTMVDSNFFLQDTGHRRAGTYKVIIIWDKTVLATVSLSDHWSLYLILLPIFTSRR